MSASQLIDSAGGKRRLQTALGDFSPVAALCVCTFGWTLVWAQALEIVRLVPEWMCAFCFFGGIAAIPFSIKRSERQPADEVASSSLDERTL